MTQTVRQLTMSRKARFRAAVALARITAREWCEEQGISQSHLYQVLRGTRTSPPLTKKIDTFIAKQLGGRIQRTTRAWTRPPAVQVRHGR